MKRLINKKQEDGVSLYITIMILGIVFSIGFTIAGLLIGEIKIARNVQSFVPAIYAADSGIERALYKARIEGGDFSPGNCLTASPCQSSGALDNGASYTVSVWDTGETMSSGSTCVAKYQCVKSIGSVRDTNRAFEVTY
ncbi:MAG: hypothetical protein R3346_01780 [Candidatus Spechtbacterales bacterium]|nr:hypothetical protein [Candidatus Spechtbacterales bacterium]